MNSRNSSRNITRKAKMLCHLQRNDTGKVALEILKGVTAEATIDMVAEITVIVVTVTTDEAVTVVVAMGVATVAIEVVTIEEVVTIGMITATMTDETTGTIAEFLVATGALVVATGRVGIAMTAGTPIKAMETNHKVGETSREVGETSKEVGVTKEAGELSSSNREAMGNGTTLRVGNKTTTGQARITGTRITGKVTTNKRGPLVKTTRQHLTTISGGHTEAAAQTTNAKTQCSQWCIYICLSEIMCILHLNYIHHSLWLRL